MKKIYKRMRPLLGTFVEIACIEDQVTAHSVLESAFKVIEEIHFLMSMHDPDSEVSKINVSLGNPVAVSIKTSILIRIAKYISFRSLGMFDITFGGHLISHGLLPNHQCLDFVGFGSSEEILVKKGLVRVPRGLGITLDGIAKGYAVDLAVKTMKKLGMQSGWVNAGGDLRVFGDISLPLFRKEANGANIFLGNLANGAFASSIVNKEPNDRYPGLIVSKAKLKYNTIVSVQAPTCLMADALTKVAALEDRVEAQKIILALGGVIV